MKIIIFTDDPGWHGAQLQQAFFRHGVEAVFNSLQQCSIDLSQTIPRIVIPDFSDLPTAVFVRGIAGGTLQQVITRLNILHMLTRQGVRVYNQVQAIERTVDKAMTSFLLRLHGVATPATWVCESRAHAESIWQMVCQRGEPLVLKPLFGSQGQGVRKLTAVDSLPVPMQQFIDGVYYLQAFIRCAGESHDYRVFVVNGKAIAAMKRTGAGWVNNVAVGGRCEPVNLGDRMADLAVRAAAAVNIDYCGVDIVEAYDGELYVLEVNSIPAWRGLQSVTDVNIAEVLVRDFLEKIDSKKID